MIRIRKWSETFENAKTRKLIHMSWLNCPSGVDSSGYLSLMSHGEKGITAFGVFIAICQWSATCRPLIRGSLARSDGKPLTIPQIAMILRMPERAVEDSIDLLMRSDINWLEKEKCEKHSENTKPATDLPVVCHAPATDLPVVPVQGEEGRGVDLDGGPSLESVSKPKRKQSTRDVVESDPLFDQFWNIYPNKVAKGLARKAWKKAIQSMEAKKIIEAAERFKKEANGKDKKFIKHPANWLNAESWLDESAADTPQIYNWDWQKLPDAEREEFVKKAMYSP